MRLSSLISVLCLFAPPAATLATTLTSAGCMCTAVGYNNGLQVAIAAPSEPAMYRIEVDADGEVLSLAYEVTAQFGPQCGDECRIEGTRMVLERGFGSSGSKFEVNIRRADDDGGPQRATVRVFRGGAMLAAETFEPDYQTDEPNGRGCGEHVHAQAQITL